MALDKKALQRELDIAAEELDKAGFAELADRVDQYSIMLMHASEKQLPQIHRGLSRIQSDYERLAAKKASEQDVKGAAAKAQNAVMSARRASLRRKIAIKRFLREKAAERKKASKKVEAIKETPKEDESPLKVRLHERIAEAKKELSQVQNRVDRLNRIREAIK
jgi:hypothetical protein